MLNILKNLINAVSVSGAEEDVSEVIKSMIADCCDEVYNDALGNLIAVKKSGNPNAKKVMMAAHMDEIGFMVTFIEDSGAVRVAPVGGINWIAVAYGEILFRNGLRGVLVPENKVGAHEYGYTKMYIDIGAKNKAEAEKKVKVGDTCTLAPNLIKLLGNRIAVTKLDDKIACVVLIQALLNMKNMKSDKDLYFVFTSQEEVGLRGAKTSTYSIMPDYAIAVDVTGTGDTPESNPMACKLGGGAAIKIMDSSVICHREMINLMMKTAEAKKIPHQSEILLGGGTDTANMQSTGTGSIAGAISIPSRYIHSGVEMCDMKDVKACVDLLVETIKAI